MKGAVGWLGCAAGLILSAACAQEPMSKTITLCNVEAIEPQALEEIRAFAERELRVPVRSVQRSGWAGYVSPQDVATIAQEERADADVLLIVVVRLDGAVDPLTVDAGRRLAVVNVQPLETEDPQRFTRRVERMVMRGAAFAIGLPPTPDPYCVTREYRSVEELDRMGRNYSPPWQGRFAEEAGKIGLLPKEK